MAKAEEPGKFELSKEEYDFCYSRVPRLTVEVLAEYDGGIALVKRSIPPFLGMWHFPGGRLLKREEVSDGVRRIARDEIGVEVEPSTLLGYVACRAMVPAGYEDYAVGLVFSATILSGEPQGGEQGEVEVFREIPTNMIPDHADFLRNHRILEQR